MPIEQYPAYRAMSSLGLWTASEARRLIPRPSSERRRDSYVDMPSVKPSARSLAEPADFCQ